MKKSSEETKTIMDEDCSKSPNEPEKKSRKAELGERIAQLEQELESLKRKPASQGNSRPKSSSGGNRSSSNKQKKSNGVSISFVIAMIVFVGSLILFWYIITHY